MIWQNGVLDLKETEFRLSLVQTYCREAWIYTLGEILLCGNVCSFTP